MNPFIYIIVMMFYIYKHVVCGNKISEYVGFDFFLLLFFKISNVNKKNKYSM